MTSPGWHCQNSDANDGRYLPPCRGSQNQAQLLKPMATTKGKLSLAALAVAGVTTTLVIQHQTRAKLREEIRSLHVQMAQLQAENESLSNRVARARSARTPRLPAPPVQVTASTTAPVEDLQPTKLYARFKDKAPKLTAEQVEAYLKANGRKALSLLAAYRTSGDPALLQEAMEKYPNDPQVAFEAAFDKDLSPEQRRQWLNAFEQAAPDNALANYLSALDYFKAGQTDQAVEELIAASGKAQFQDYGLDRVQDDEEAYLAAGYSEAEAAAIATQSLLLPHLQPLRELGRDFLVPLANSYQQVGDEESAQAALQMGLNLGQRLNGSAGLFLVGNCVGIAIERSVLGAMDPNSPYGSIGQTVQNQLDALTQQMRALATPGMTIADEKLLGVQEGGLLPTLSDQELLNFSNRVKLFGEEAAVRWLVSKYGQEVE